MTNLSIALMLALQAALPGIKQDRLRAVSQDMVSVVSEEFSSRNLQSSLTEEDALHMLAAVAVGESALRRDIENCKVSGDGGRSVGLGQVMRGPNWKGYTRKEICGNRKIQFKLALHVIDACWSRTPNTAASFRCYTTGNPDKNSYAARHEYSMYRSVKSSLRRHLIDQKIDTCNLESLSTFYVREINTCEL
jgi:hypothetical protein